MKINIGLDRNSRGLLREPINYLISPLADERSSKLANDVLNIGKIGARYERRERGVFALEVVLARVLLARRLVHVYLEILADVLDVEHDLEYGARPRKRLVHV